MNITLEALPHSPSLASTLDIALARARHEQSGVLATHTEELDYLPDSLAFLAAGMSTGLGGVFWSQPQHGLTFAGIGAAQEVTAEGPERFTRIATAFRRIQESVIGHRRGTPFPIFCAFAFGDSQSPRSSIWHDFPNSRLVVPAAMLQIGDGRALVRTTVEVHPSDTLSALVERSALLLAQCRHWLDAKHPALTAPQIAGTLAIPTRSRWQSSVASVTALMQQGVVDKVVLARQEQLVACSEWSPIDTLSQLEKANSRATLFGLQAGPSWFVGASPERLVRLHARQVEVSCLAGSIAIGQTDDENQRQAERLLASAKDREEHEIVVKSTIAALAQICDRVTRAPASPHVVAARSVLHLESPLFGTLSRCGTVLDLVARLHPTPAVGGYPREPALAVIRELEEIDRGWYASPIGWVDIDGSGEFAVALRSALLSGHTASLFAGSGIVRHSDPEAEFAETDLKLAPMRSALLHA